MKQQVCIIGGGQTFNSDADYLSHLKAKELQYERLLYAPSWKNWIAEQLPDHDVLLPSMPNKQNAKYEEWSLYFSKIVPFLRQDTLLIGHSLGGIFLAKYFTEHLPSVPYRKLILVAAPYDDETGESLGDFKLTDTTTLPAVTDEIHLLHSIDDPVVPISEKDKYLLDVPEAQVKVFSDRHHFIDSDFPELLELITS